MHSDTINSDLYLLCNNANLSETVFLPLGERFKNWSTSCGSSLIWGLKLSQSSFTCNNTHKSALHIKPHSFKHWLWVCHHAHIERFNLCGLREGGVAGVSHRIRGGTLGGQSEGQGGQQDGRVTQERFHLQSFIFLLHGPLVIVWIT